MKKIYIELDKSSYQNIRNFLFHDQSEHVVFLLAKVSKEPTKIIFKILNYKLIPDSETDSSAYDLRLKEEVQSKIIKWAWDNQASLIEIHSHPFYKTATSFSSYDLEGFEEFVPHVWWRLKGKPYIALVFGPMDYDALAWIDNPNDSIAIEGILVNGELLKPTNHARSFNLWKK